MVVKYCIVRNRRFSFSAATDENGAVIPYGGAYDEHAFDLGILRTPAHRPRRERKLLTQTEIEQRFPVKKYKLWRTEREFAGLPSEGGVASVVASRAASVRSVRREGEAEKDGMEGLKAVASTSETVVGTSTDEDPAGKAATVVEETITELHPELECTLTAETYATTRLESDKDNSEEEEEDDDGVRAHPNMNTDLPEAGDVCVICLETLEDDHNVRGLTCGHAFHSYCIDPWFTARRACCPLCKTDYYISGLEAQIAAPDSASRRIEGHPGIVFLQSSNSSVGYRGVVLNPTMNSAYSGRSTWQDLFQSRFVRAHLPRSRRHNETTEAEIATERQQQQQPQMTPDQAEAMRIAAENEERRRRRRESRRQRHEAMREQQRREEESSSQITGLGLHSFVI